MLLMLFLFPKKWVILYIKYLTYDKGDLWVTPVVLKPYVWVEQTVSRAITGFCFFLHFLSCTVIFWFSLCLVSEETWLSGQAISPLFTQTEVWMHSAPSAQTHTALSLSGFGFFYTIIFCLSPESLLAFVCKGCCTLSQGSNMRKVHVQSLSGFSMGLIGEGELCPVKTLKFQNWFLFHIRTKIRYFKRFHGWGKCPSEPCLPAWTIMLLAEHSPGLLERQNEFLALWQSLPPSRVGVLTIQLLASVVGFFMDWTRNSILDLRNLPGEKLFGFWQNCSFWWRKYFMKKFLASHETSRSLNCLP